MKNILLVLMLLLIAACSNPSEKNAEANQALVKNYLEAAESKDYDAMASMLSEDYMGLGPSVGDTTNKANALASFKYNNENLYESIKYDFSQMIPATIEEGMATGEWVANWTYVTINYKDGRGPINLWVNAVYKIENGVIARSRTFYNEADALAQLGYRVFPPLTVPEEPTSTESN